MNPQAYLARSVRHAQADVARSRQREVLVSQVPSEAVVGESPVEEALGASAADVVTMALDSAVAGGERALARTASVWLDLADELGRAPSGREVAARLGVSHQTVQNHLRRLRAYF